MNPPSFTSSSVTEDPESFVEDLQKVFEIMHVKLDTYQMKGVARIWFDQWKKNRVEGALHVSWDYLEEAFLGISFPETERVQGKRVPHS